MVLSVLPIRQEEYETGGSPFLLNVKREGVKVEEAKATLDAAREFIAALETHLTRPRQHR
ncbi:MAG: hypothetical protein ACE5I9_05245 [Candidatus Methylomirabilales bacterium]